MIHLDPTIIRYIMMFTVVGLVLLAFTYLVKFVKPLIIAAILITIAYFLYRYTVTGTFSF
ncbi:hypothetical protein HGB07_04085 [Candidatus Roizmanbacteria bacterium]|nr:hypothetical protein [Candidatus Roizmanbacteria bacterium]